MTRLGGELFPRQGQEACVIAQQWEYTEALSPSNLCLVISVHKRSSDYLDYLEQMKDPEVLGSKIEGSTFKAVGPPLVAVAAGQAFTRVIEAKSNGVLLFPEYDDEFISQMSSITTFN